jgi:hypothetical protein
MSILIGDQGIPAERVGLTEVRIHRAARCPTTTMTAALPHQPTTAMVAAPMAGVEAVAVAETTDICLKRAFE